MPILSGLMGRSRPVSSAAAVREKDVTRTDARTVPLDGAPDLASEVRRLARARRAEDAVLRGDAVVPLADLFEGAGGLSQLASLVLLSCAASIRRDQTDPPAAPTGSAP